MYNNNFERLFYTYQPVSKSKLQGWKLVIGSDHSESKRVWSGKSDFQWQGYDDYQKYET